jgi:D-aminopeptidase
MGSVSGNGSGDIFIAFSTANRAAMGGKPLMSAEFVGNDSIDSLFGATVQATEEAIVNALIAGRDMDGTMGRYVKGIPQAELIKWLDYYHRRNVTP